MDLDEARAFLVEHHRAILATARADGQPQMSPISVALDSEGRGAGPRTDARNHEDDLRQLRNRLGGVLYKRVHRLVG